MGLVLETDDDTKMNYLLTSNIPSLTETALTAGLQDNSGESTELYNLIKADGTPSDIVTYEAVSYLLSVDSKDNPPSTPSPGIRTQVGIHTCSYLSCTYILIQFNLFILYVITHIFLLSQVLLSVSKRAAKVMNSAKFVKSYVSKLVLYVIEGQHIYYLT